MYYYHCILLHSSLAGKRKKSISYKNVIDEPVKILISIYFYLSYYIMKCVNIAKSYYIMKYVNIAKTYVSQ